MGSFNEQAFRLMREVWPNANLLAQEIFAIFRSWTDKGLNGPLTINNGTNQPAITINQLGDSPASIQVKGPDSTVTLTLGNQGNFQQGGITLEGLTQGNLALGNITPGNVQPPQETQPSEPSGGGGGASNTFIGVVVSGTGSSYLVNIDAGAAQPTIVSVTQLQIDPNELIPAGTVALVVRSGSSYFMQVPVWLS